MSVPNWIYVTRNKACRDAGLLEHAHYSFCFDSKIDAMRMQMKTLDQKCWSHTLTPWNAIIITIFFLSMSCRGEWTLSWAWPDHKLTNRPTPLAGGRSGGRREALVSECPGQPGRQYCKRLTLTAAQAKDTGFYRCYYKDVSDVIVGTTAVSVYVFVRGESEKSSLKTSRHAPLMSWVKANEAIGQRKRVTTAFTAKHRQQKEKLFCRVLHSFSFAEGFDSKFGFYRDLSHRHPQMLLAECLQAALAFHPDK